MVQGALAELIVGIKADPHFGLVLVIGAGGILVELLEDAARLLLPASRADIEAALRGLKVFRLLDGYRGRPEADVHALVDAIEAVASYAQSHLATIAEIDVNPLMVSADGKSAIAVDALIVEHIENNG
jgi:acetate---CoA ligase (ADP-forming)